MQAEYKQVNKLWCYSFETKELFTIPSPDVPDKPAFLYDSYPEKTLLELSVTHSVCAISFYSCETEEVLKRLLSGVLPKYYMVELYKKWCRCTIVEEGTENIYKDVKKSWRSYENPGDIMVRVSYNGRLVRTHKVKVLPFDSTVCKT